MKSVIVPSRSWGNVGLSRSVRYQGRGIAAASPSLDAGAEVIQHSLPLPSAGMNDCQNAFDEPAALLAVRTSAGLPQQHPVPPGSLAFVVRRFHSFGVHAGGPADDLDKGSSR